MSRRPVVAVIGQSGPLPDSLVCDVVALGTALVDAGWRIVSGGRDGVMAAVSEGAHASASYREGDVVGILPGYDATEANPHVDIVVPTGLGIARNVLVVAMADVVVAVAGGPGTLSEIALAWQLGRPVIALTRGEGWAVELAGRRIDPEREQTVVAAADVAAVVVAVQRALASGQ